MLQEILRHEQYSRTTNKNDIALIRVKEKIIFSFDVRPACLNTDLNDQNLDADLITIGWGSKSAESKFQSQLKWFL